MSDRDINLTQSRPAMLPAQVAGQWVAWNRDMTEIVSHGSELASVRDEALAKGCDEPVMQKTLPAVAFIG